ncbi:MAG: aromatic amino acid lyase [Chlorobi bacterium]|nr:aromatic amino acid lyase [Chlorobiota bacterium]
MKKNHINHREIIPNVIEATHRWKQIISQNNITLSAEEKERINKSFETLQEILKTSHKAIYGVNTGFGALWNKRIKPDELEELQYNLLRSHAAGTGEPLPDDIVKGVIYLKIKNFTKGFSAVSMETVKRLIFFYENNIIPYVPSEGSLGASGDLAPLAHLSLSLIGEGKIKINDKWIPTGEFYSQWGLEPIALNPKEGLALINGTQVSQAILAKGLWEAYRLWTIAHLIAIVSMKAFHCRYDHFDPALDKATNHRTRILSAHIIRKFWGEQTEPFAVQDPYSFRCVPHVMGAVADAMEFASSILLREMESVSDNPLLIDGNLWSGGHFHAEPLLIAADSVRRSLERIAQVSERRQWHLLSGNRGLPPFLAIKPGLHSGLMIPHYNSTYQLAKLTQLVNPITGNQAFTSAGQEDHVSYAPLSANRLLKAIDSIYDVLTWELVIATRAIMLANKGHTLHPELNEQLVKPIIDKFPELADSEIVPSDIFYPAKQILIALSRNSDNTWGLQ